MDGELGMDCWPGNHSRLVVKLDVSGLFSASYYAAAPLSGVSAGEHLPGNGAVGSNLAQRPPRGSKKSPLKTTARVIPDHLDGGVLESRVVGVCIRGRSGALNSRRLDEPTIEGDEPNRQAELLLDLLARGELDRVSGSQWMPLQEASDTSGEPRG